MSWQVIKFAGRFQDAVNTAARDWIGELGETVNPPGLPARVEVNIDDWIASDGKGERMRFAFLTWTSRELLDAWPSLYIPQGTLVALWPEPRDPAGFPAAVWSKWYAAVLDGAA